MDSPKPQFHATDLGMLDRCQMQFYYRRIENLIVPPAVAMVIGSATHRSVEANMRKKIETGKLVLEHTAGNRTEAARILGIGISTLWRHLKEKDPSKGKS